MPSPHNVVTWVLVVSRAESNDRSFPSERVIEFALGQCARSWSKGQDATHVEISTIVVDEALSSWSHWQKAVDILAQAQIAFVDISLYRPGVMLLLGVRSVLRRGITITFRNHGGDLPWNIKEVRPVDLDRHDLSPRVSGPGMALERFQAAIRDAWQRYTENDNHQDLPVYAAVRTPIGEPSGPIDWTELALVLCSFSDRYVDDNWSFLRDNLDQFLHPKVAPSEPNIVRTLDMHSTSLISRVLYDYIRRCEFCIVDLTEWRPSVLFELGVRMAASPIAPAVLLETDSGDLSLDSQSSAIAALLAPIAYKARSDDMDFLNELDVRFGSLFSNEPILADSQVHGLTDWTIVKRFDIISDQRPAPPPHIQLLNAAHALKAKIETGLSPVLYSENEHVRRLAHESSVEHLLAAWFYLTGRYSQEEILAKADLRQAVENVGREILSEAHSRHLIATFADAITKKLEQLEAKHD